MWLSCRVADDKPKAIEIGTRFLPTKLLQQIILYQYHRSPEEDEEVAAAAEKELP